MWCISVWRSGAARVEEDLGRRYSPEQISRRLRRDFPDDAEMQVHHETIYQSLYVQARGGLRADLTKSLRKFIYGFFLVLHT